MVAFICIGLLDLWGAQTENYKMKKFLPTVGFEPGTFRYEANALSVEPSGVMYIECLKVTAFHLKECDIYQLK